MPAWDRRNRRSGLFSEVARHGQCSMFAFSTILFVILEAAVHLAGGSRLFHLASMQVSVLEGFHTT